MRHSLDPKPSHDLRQVAPPAASQLLTEANIALAEHRPELAMQALGRALEVALNLVDIWRMMAAVQRKLGLHADAVASLTRATELAPEEPLTHVRLGIALHQCGRVDDALVEFERACKLAPESSACWFNLGNALKIRGQLSDRACIALERALEIDPGHIAARLTLAEAQTMLGRRDAAIKNYHDVLRQQPANHRAWLGLASTRTEPFSASETNQLATLLHDAGPSTEAGITLGFALSRALEDQGDYVAAFAALATANACKRSMLDWNAAMEEASIDAIQAAFATPCGDGPETQRGSEIIFIVSMPRSGSTLVEQMLASHPEVEGGGELLELQQVIDNESALRGRPLSQWAREANEHDWARLGEEYLQRTAPLRNGSPRLTDKNLLNWKLVGPALAMLPGAHVVNIRRDPVKTCLACFRQLFRTGNGFSYDLGDLATYWQLHDRLCRHWQHLYPRRFLEIQYEGLVARPEAEIRRLLDFCGLDFDPACLDFHQTQREIRTASAVQVRQPLRQETALGKHYGEMLAPLRARLDSAIGH